MTKNSQQERNWWKEGVIYQIYPRSFKDTSGNGVASETSANLVVNNVGGEIASTHDSLSTLSAMFPNEPSRPSCCRRR